MRAAKLGSCMQALFRKNTSACLPAWLVGGDLIYYSELARTETKKRCRSPADAKGYYLQGRLKSRLQSEFYSLVSPDNFQV